jgi:hypothetical protein
MKASSGLRTVGVALNGFGCGAGGGTAGGVDGAFTITGGAV